MTRLSTVAALCSVLAAPVLAAPFVVPIDPAQSTLNFQLCISESCSTDSSPVAGTATLELANVSDPQQIWLHDFDFQLVENLHWYISWSFLGSFTADVTDVAIAYAYPGTPLGPNPITSGTFSFTGVPVETEGMLTYSAVGLPCTVLQAAGLLCSDTQSLDQGTQTADTLGGTITSASRVVTLVTNIDILAPLDPAYPEMGTLHVSGTVRGSVYVPPAAGDTNCDGAVNVFDIDPFVLALVDSAAYASAFPACEISTADTNGDGEVNVFDIDPFVLLLTGG
ncbi:MAG: hypothetical protein GX547_10795 [Phycisphaerae bacterium]|nr:hypothetical protein [Phycisphaerae bacterium]